MSKSVPRTAHSRQPDDFGVRLRIYKDIADVTWRMFVPSIGGAVLGVLGDRSFGTTPWLTVTGITFGFVVVGWLVWQQVRDTKGKD